MKFKHQKFVWVMLVSIITLMFFSISCSLRQESEIVKNNILPKQSNNNSELNNEETELERNQKLWRESKSGNYKMTLKMSQPGLYSPVSPVEITVKNGEAVSIKSLEDSERNITVESYERFGNNTVKAMFEKIQFAENRKPDKLKVKYDEKFGYPKEIDIDISFLGNDDESYLKVEKFEILN